MSIPIWVLIAALILGAAVTIWQIGRPREPITPGYAAIAVVIDIGLIGALLFFQGTR